MKPKNGNLPKFKSVCTSAALCVNNFAFLKKDIDLSNDVSFLNYNKFKESKFEAKLSTGLKGYSPNLDISLVNDLVIIGVESKFIEILTPKLPNQKRPDKDYGSLDPYYISSKVDYYVDFKENVIKPYIECTDKLYLDVSQLIKHTLGLINR